MNTAGKQNTRSGQRDNKGATKNNNNNNYNERINYRRSMPGLLQMIQKCLRKKRIRNNNVFVQGSLFEILSLLGFLVCVHCVWLYCFLNVYIAAAKIWCCCWRGAYTVWTHTCKLYNKKFCIRFQSKNSINLWPIWLFFFYHYNYSMGKSIKSAKFLAVRRVFFFQWVVDMRWRWSIEQSVYILLSLSEM